MTLGRPHEPQDRAAVVATAAVQIVRHFVVGWFRTGKLDGLHAALTEDLRDEIADIERQTASDIRPQDE
jgi:hypothetical protein